MKEYRNDDGSVIYATGTQINTRTLPKPLGGGHMPDKRLKLLFVDDELPVLAALSRLFRSHEVHFASSYYEAARIVLVQDGLNAVVTDSLDVNEKSGLMLLRLTAVLHPRANRIMFSGSGRNRYERFIDPDEGAIQRFFNKGDYHLLKDHIDMLQ